MKLEGVTTVLEKSAVFAKESFRIGNTSVILNILRNKMYSDPIMTVVQEYAANARHAHREVGKTNVPIEITLPNPFSNLFCVRDFGPGITPDRMSNVFIQYGNSTKRSDNIQTGGFGLGAKSAFALGDNFSIESITPENIWEQGGVVYNDVMIKRTYVAIIDESQVGELNLISEEMTDEAQGTKIILAVKDEDYDKFMKCTERVGRYWTPQPVIHGNLAFKYQRPKADVSGTNWELSQSVHHDRKIFAVLDGIIYPVNLDKIPDAGIDRYDKILEHTLTMFFNAGDLMVTANREELDYGNENTVKNLRAGFNTLQTELKNRVITNIAAETSLIAAHHAFMKFKTMFGANISGQFGTWNGVKVTGSCDLGTSVRHYYLDHKDRLKYEPSSSLELIKNVDCIHIIYDNEPGEEVNRAKLRLYIKEHNLDHSSKIQVIKAYIDTERMDAVSKYIHTAQEKWDEDNAKHRLDLLGIKNMSDLPKPVRVAKMKDVNGVKVPVKWHLVKEFETGYVGCNFQCCIKDTDLDIEDDSGVFIYYHDRHFTGSTDITCTPEFRTEDLKRVLKFLGISTLNCISLKQKHNVGDGWVHLVDKMLEYVQLNSVKVRNVSINTEFNYTDKFHYNDDKMLAAIPNITDPNSLFVQYVQANTDSDVTYEGVKFISALLGSTPVFPNMVSVDIQTLWKQVLKKYPLLQIANDYTQARELTEKELIWYVNAKDSI